MLIGGGFVLLIVGLILMFVFLLKMGKADERTNQIQLKSTLIMLFVVILCDIIFPKEYMWQIFFLFKYAFAFITAGIYLAVRYILTKELNRRISCINPLNFKNEKLGSTFKGNK